ncbi:arginine deiminase family protein [Helicobacter sp. 13S00477-4]|uniref:dimethylarginine dimethylaminohydrolase family protein n=1 Tax=Helicobacter sp. 13S00477-4 TaxID=1905759 RepID=UPI000BA737A7|nr:arginine deiminase family protein [Helicobacter sp. 13S00477-4]PAF51930.1 N(G),N(G)-dimethylarginine dimethylaminohydrolase [Helicobacter sp. 13S00477-4]
MFFKNAIVRIPPRTIINGITSANLGKPIYEKALKQHEDYVIALTKAGLNVTVLEPKDEFPDSCFVEDVALCTKHCVIISRPGASTRQKEVELEDMQSTLKKFYQNIEYIQSPGTVEPGDILMIGNHFYIGLSKRTNQEGANQMIKILEKYQLSGSIVTLEEFLHLKTGINYIENNNIVVAGEFINKTEFAQYNKIIIPESEAYSANCLWVNDYVLVPKGFPTILEKVNALGYETLEVDTSEFRKIDGGLTCLSLRF